MELPGFYFIPIWLILPRKLLFIFFITFQFALAFWFGTWRKKGAAEQKKNSKKSINPSASNYHPWIDNYFRDRNVSNFETLKELSDDLWNKKMNILTYVIPRWAITVVYRSKTFQFISRSHRSRTSYTKQVRATSLLQAGSPGNNQGKLISSLSRYIIQRPPVSSSR